MVDSDRQASSGRGASASTGAAASADGSVVPLIGRGRCEYPGGRIDLLYVRSLNARSAELVCSDPPPPGTLVSLELFVGDTWIPPLSGQVAQRVSGSVEQRGFRVDFRAMSAPAYSAVRQTLRPAHGERSGAARGELASSRRAEPRVWVQDGAIALLHAERETRRGCVATLSTTGALVAFDGPSPPGVFLPGRAVTVDFAFVELPERISSLASIVRPNAPSEPFGVGLRFLNVSSSTRSRLEGVVRYVQGGDMDEGRVCDSTRHGE